MSFLESFKRFNETEKLFEKNERILIAFSGGIDSALLCDVFCRIRSEYDLEITAAYFNHNLRGDESEREERFVRDFAEKYDMRLEISTGEVEKTAQNRNISIQESARLHRYDFLNQVCGRLNIDKIATGHHLDDNIESVLMGFLNGSGINGLKGIPVKRGNIIRPLLWARRSEISKYSENNSIEFFEDSTNIKTKYLRNRIRHKILPCLRENLDADIDAILVGQQKRFSEYHELLHGMTEEILKTDFSMEEKGKITLDITDFNKYFIILQKNVVFECFNSLGGVNKAQYNDFFEKIKKLIDGTFSREYVYMSSEIFARIDNNKLIISLVETRDFEKQIEIGKRYVFEEQNFSFRSEVIEADNISSGKWNKEFKKEWDEVIDCGSIKEPLMLRFWRSGDRFKPLGMDKEKKLSDFFIDQKIPVEDKKSMSLLSDADKIIWICGNRISEDVKIKSSTVKIVGLKYGKLIN